MSWNIEFEWHSGTITSYREENIIDALKRAKRSATGLKGYHLKSIYISDETELPKEVQEELLFLESRFDDKISDPTA